MKLPGPFAISRVVEMEGPFRPPEFLLPEATPELFATTVVAKDPRFYDAASNRLIMGFYSLIVRTSRNDRYPSDHFPVVARVRLPQ